MNGKAVCTTVARSYCEWSPATISVAVVGMLGSQYALRPSSAIANIAVLIILDILL
jgi:hypothetical protein